MNDTIINTVPYQISVLGVSSHDDLTVTHGGCAKGVDLPKEPGSNSNKADSFLEPTEMGERTGNQASLHQISQFNCQQFYRQIAWAVLGVDVTPYVTRAV